MFYGHRVYLCIIVSVVLVERHLQKLHNQPSVGYITLTALYDCTRPRHSGQDQLTGRPLACQT